MKIRLQFVYLSVLILSMLILLPSAVYLTKLKQNSANFQTEIDRQNYIFWLSKNKQKPALAKEVTTNTIEKSSEAETTKRDEEVATKASNKPEINLNTDTGPQIIIPSDNKPKIINPDWETINHVSRAATVNIVCTTPSGGLLNPVSGSGVMISEKGVILTNAHIAQFFLLNKLNGSDFFDCVVRSGSPAIPLYRAKILHIPEEWVVKHADDIKLSSPVGTGEKDFALLLLDRHVNPNNVLPETFPFIDIEKRLNTEIVGSPVLISTYPAGFLGGVTIQTNLFLASAEAKISDIFTFSSTTIDLISLTGNVAAQRGSSGGAVVNHEGLLEGIIVTTSEEAQTSDRDLRAITLSYVNRELEQDTGLGLKEMFNNNLNAISDKFYQENFARYAKILQDSLLKN